MKRSCEKFSRPDGSQFVEAVVPYVEGLTEAMDNEVILIRGIEPVQIPDIIRHTAGFDEKKCEKEPRARAEGYPSKKGECSARQMCEW